MDRAGLLFHFLYFCLMLRWSHPQVVNVARDKPAEQKRGYAGYFTWGADKAVDGCYQRDDPENEECCSASILDLNFDDPSDNYWRVNLTQLYQVESIVIYARLDKDQLSGFTLHTIRAPGDNEVLVPSVTQVDNVYTFTFSPLEDVTEVVVRRTSDDNTLTICEVDVIAACLDGYYGVNCVNICSRGCFNNTACDKTSGVCINGCESGYYGHMCIQCGNCLNNAPCNSTTGICMTGCADGWRGDYCTEADITKATDCKALYDDGVTASGVYTIQPHTSNSTFKAYCDMVTDGGGWTEFQRREDGTVNFEVGWDSYRDGFGSPAGEHWLGLEHLNQIISQRPHEMRVDMVDWANVTKYAYYNHFTISPASDKYRLSISGYNGTAGDSMTYHNKQQFSTPGSDNDVYDRDCAGLYKGGWWYKSCHYSNLNGHYVPGGNHKTNADGINWYHWHGYHYSLKTTEMKIRIIL